jgi:hypothetical protein
MTDMLRVRLLADKIIAGRNPPHWTQAEDSVKCDARTHPSTNLHTACAAIAATPDAAVAIATASPCYCRCCCRTSVLPRPPLKGPSQTYKQHLTPWRDRWGRESGPILRASAPRLPSAAPGSTTMREGSQAFSPRAPQTAGIGGGGSSGRRLLSMHTPPAAARPVWRAIGKPNTLGPRGTPKPGSRDLFSTERWMPDGFGQGDEMRRTARRERCA